MSALTAILYFIALLVFFSILVSFPLMWLWNWLMPVLFGLPEITILQAVGIYFLSGLLFKSPSVQKD